MAPVSTNLILSYIGEHVLACRNGILVKRRRAKIGRLRELFGSAEVHEELADVDPRGHSIVDHGIVQGSCSDAIACIGADTRNGSGNGGKGRCG